MYTSSLQVCVAVVVPTVDWIVWNSRRCSSVSDEVSTHVLHDEITMIVGVVTRVLICPLDTQNGALIVVQTPHIVATSVVILRVKHSISIVPISICFIQTVIATSVTTFIFKLLQINVTGIN